MTTYYQGQGLPSHQDLILKHYSSPPTANKWLEWKVSYPLCTGVVGVFQSTSWQGGFCLELVYNIKYYNLTKNICFEAIQNGSKSNNAPGLNRGLSSKFWWLRRANNVKFADECVKCMENHVLVKKRFINGWNMGLSLWTWVKKTIYGLEMHWCYSKEKILGAALSKEGHADSLLGYEKTNHHWFPWKRCNCKQCFLLQIH